MLTVIQITNLEVTPTSDEVPGLTAETDTREEVIDLERELAMDLLELDGEVPDRKHQKFAFLFLNK